MPKGNRKGSRRRRGDDTSSEEEEDGDKHGNNNNNKIEQQQQQRQHTVVDESSDLGFAERRELQRKKAAEKRRSKQKCFLCGKAGHVRRECPGVADDGRGHSKYAKAKGDTGATTLKASGGRNTKGSKQDASANSTAMIAGLELPEGFESHVKDPHVESSEVERKEPFLYYDSMCDGYAILQYLQNGRSGVIYQKTKEEAVEEFRRILSKSMKISNFGGCIAQVYLKTNQPWTTETSPPLPWWDDENEEYDPISVNFVVGLNHGYDSVNDAEKSKATLKAASHDPRVVGFCTKLDYSEVGFDREAQLARVYCTCDVAVQVHLPVQIQLLHETVVRSESMETDTQSSYAAALRDLLELLQSPRYVELKVHLCSWSGLSEDMTALLQRFPSTLWIGMDGSVSFSKATIAHECAFDIPMDKLMLEIGSIIPSQVASALGRKAFPHSGLIPYVAAAVAQHKKYVSAEQVARAASHNTMTLYKIPR